VTQKKTIPTNQFKVLQLTFGIIWKMYNIRFKKTRITEFIPHYFTLHDDANIKARLKQDKPCT